MIQRIQSLWLLLITGLMVSLYFLPLMWFGHEGQQVQLYAMELRTNGISIGSTPIYLPLLIGLAALLPLITLLLFKRRMLQIRLCAAEAVLLVGVAAMEAMLYWGPQNTLDNGALMPASFIPLAALLFVWLAARAIFKDELLVRSLDRIR